METNMNTNMSISDGDLAFEIDLELEHEKKLNMLEKLHIALMALRKVIKNEKSDN